MYLLDNLIYNPKIMEEKCQNQINKCIILCGFYPCLILGCWQLKFTRLLNFFSSFLNLVFVFLFILRLVLFKEKSKTNKSWIPEITLDLNVRFQHIEIGAGKSMCWQNLPRHNCPANINTLVRYLTWSTVKILLQTSPIIRFFVVILM